MRKFIELKYWSSGRTFLLSTDLITQVFNNGDSSTVIVENKNKEYIVSTKYSKIKQLLGVK